MKLFPGFPDFFISPLSGAIREAVSLPDLERGYVWVGDKNNRPTPTFKLIDLKIDVQSLQKQFEDLYSHPFIVSTPVPSLKKSQALSTLGDGILKNKQGKLEIATPNIDYMTASLPEGKIWIGDSSDKPSPQPNIKVSNLPDLSQANLWIGDSSNRPSSQPHIELSQLPDLGVASIAGEPLPAGKIWRGTASGRPEESNAVSKMEAELLHIHEHFLFTNFIIGKGIKDKIFIPSAQFLESLQPGILRHTAGVISIAEPGVGYVDAEGVPVENNIPVWSENGQKLLRNSGVTIDDMRDIRNVNILNAHGVVAGDSVQSNNSVIALNSLQTRHLFLFDFVHPYTLRVVLKAPHQLNGTIEWTFPDTLGTTGQVLTDIGIDTHPTDPLSPGRLLGFRNILPDGLENGLLARGQNEQGHPIFVNAPLQEGRVWRGNDQNRPVEVQLEIPSKDATYILKRNPADLGLQHAQGLDQLAPPPNGGVKILKAAADGSIEVAVPDEDYVRLQTLEEIRDETEQFRNQAQEFRNASSNSAEAAAGSAEGAAGSAAAAAGAAGEASLSATGAAASAVAAFLSAGSASASSSNASGHASDAKSYSKDAKDSAKSAHDSAVNALHHAEDAADSATNAQNSSTAAQGFATDAQNSATAASNSSTSAKDSADSAENSLNTLLNTGITLQGAILGSGSLRNPIDTLFQDNPVLPGKKSVTIPGGLKNERPLISTKGMLRYIVK